MKLLSCHVENFGRLHNFDCDFSDGLTEIFHDNGWGKTTLAVFLKAMLFGMPKKGNNKAYAVERSKYFPWQGGVYGGTITFEHNGGKYKMYRTFGSTPERDMFSLIDLSTNQKTTKFTENFGYEIYGVGRETFEITTFFPQADRTGKLTDEVRASLSGTKNLQNDLKNYSKGIERIENKIKIYKKEISSISKFDVNLEKVEKIEKQIENDKNQILKILDEIEVLQENMEQLKDDYQKAQKELEVKELFRKEITELKDKVITRKSDLLAFQIKLEELKKENEKRSLRNRFILSNKKIRSILYYSSMIICMALLTLFAFELIYNASIWFKIFTILFIFIDIALIYYCIWAKRKDRIKLNPRIEIEKYQKTVDDLHKEIENLQNVMKAKEENQTDIVVDGEDDKNRLVKEYSDCEKNIDLNKMQMAYIQKGIEEFEAEKDALLTEHTTMQRTKSILENKIKLLNLTRDFLGVAKLNLSTRFVAPMQEKFTNFVREIVEHNDEKYSLDVDMNVTVDSPSGTKEVEYLSQGYQDLMCICRRFSLIDSIFEKEKPLVILDDPFVNLDDAISKNAVRLLEKLSESYQIVYLCCHTSRKIFKND